MSCVKWLYPASIEEALEALAETGSRPVAGGTTVLDLVKLGHPLPKIFIDISRLPLGEITQTEHALTIGSLASNTNVAKAPTVRQAFPAIAQAILSGASQQIRNAASVGGNLMQATRCPYFRTIDWPCNRRSPGSGCEALHTPTHAHAILGSNARCIAVHPSDMAVALAALDATIKARTIDDDFSLPLADFYLETADPSGEKMALPGNALITAVEVPRSEAAARSGYLKLRGRASYEFATVSVAAALLCKSGKVQTVAVSLGGVASRPWRRKSAERLLIGATLSHESIERFCDVLLEGADTRPETLHKIALSRRAVHRMLRTLA
jgi:xanthine dehydrogenase YagS FAD-binding subunit